MTTTPMPELPKLPAGEARVQHGTLVIYPPDNYTASQMQAYARAAIEASQPAIDDVHSCSFFCDLPACIKTQRDLLRDQLTKEAK